VGRQITLACIQICSSRPYSSRANRFWLSIAVRDDGIGFEFDPETTTFVLSRSLLVPAERSRLARWRRRLFIVLSRNALAAERFFRLSPNQVVELGMQVEI